MTFPLLYSRGNRFILIFHSLWYSRELTMLSLLCLGLGLLSHATAAPSSEARAAAPIVELPYATVMGSSSMGIDSFIGIPYAKPPVEQLRLKPPQPISSNLGVLLLPQKAKQCPQFLTQYEATILPADALTETLTSPLLQFVPEQAEAVLAQLLDNSVAQNLEDEGEDCLTVSVQRPSTATKDSKLPVVFWIFGGEFEFGSTQSNDASDLIKNSVSQGKDIMYVAVNYRIGGFGFLPGKELLEDSSTNLGLLDQRLGLEWVADFVDKFGGDPEKVTIWGESAGSIVRIIFSIDNSDRDKTKSLSFPTTRINTAHIFPISFERRWNTTNITTVCP